MEVSGALSVALDPGAEKVAPRVAAGRDPLVRLFLGLACGLALLRFVALARWSLWLDEALTLLAEEDPLAARVAEHRHFAGAGHEAVAAALGITVYAARQKWTYARAWLRDAMADDS